MPDIKDTARHEAPGAGFSQRPPPAIDEQRDAAVDPKQGEGQQLQPDFGLQGGLQQQPLHPGEQQTVETEWVTEKRVIGADNPNFEVKEREQEHEHKGGAGEKIQGLGARAAAGIGHAAHAVGESIKAGTGHLDAVDMLLSQHNETESFISRIESNKDPKSRHRLLESMCDNLVSRMRVEEEIFYPAMAREGLRSWDQVQQSISEHNEVKNLMTVLLKLNPADADFDVQFATLKQLLERHVQEEKFTFFPSVKERMDSQKLKHLGKEMHERFSDLMGEKHPRYGAFEDVGKPVPTKETREPAHKS